MRRRLIPLSMGIAMFVLGVAIPVLIREPAKGRYTPLTKARSDYSSWWTACVEDVPCHAAGHRMHCVACVSASVPVTGWGGKAAARAAVSPSRAQGMLREVQRASMRAAVCLPMLSSGSRCDSSNHLCAQASEAGLRFRVWPALRYLMTMRTFWILTLAVGAQPVAISPQPSDRACTGCARTGNALVMGFCPSTLSGACPRHQLAARVGGLRKR